jgi:HEAT repeat protein
VRIRARFDRAAERKRHFEKEAGKRPGWSAVPLAFDEEPVFVDGKLVWRAQGADGVDLEFAPLPPRIRPAVGTDEPDGVAGSTDPKPRSRNVPDEPKSRSRGARDVKSPGDQRDPVATRPPQPASGEVESAAPATEPPAPPREVSPLVRALKTDDLNGRRDAAMALRASGLDSPDAVRAWAEALHDEDQHVRSEASAAFEQLGDRAVVLLVADLEWPHDANVRWRAASALGKLGTDARSVILALGRALDDENKNVRWQAAHGLGEIGPPAAPSLDRLVRALSDEDEVLRWHTAMALGKLGPAAAASVPRLKALAASDSRRVRATAQWALDRIVEPGND